MAILKIVGMRMRTTALLLIGMSLAISPFLAEALDVRIKDIADVQGISANQLIGFGVIAGLPGTGDSNRTIVASQALVNMLSRMDLQVSLNELQANNAAAVVVTAEVPPFARLGDHVDVKVASIGDARQISGCQLLLTPLRGADGRIYARAMGRLEQEPTDRSQVRRTTPNPVGKVPNGATLIQDIPDSLGRMQTLSIRLRDADFMTSALMAKAINEMLGSDTAIASDNRTVLVRVPVGLQAHLVDFIATVNEIRVSPDVPARVVINERTGTVIISETVRISKVAIAHRDMSLDITDTPGEDATLQDVIRALNAVGTTPRDLIEILKLMKAAGALQAEIIVM